MMKLPVLMAISMVAATASASTTALRLTFADGSRETYNLAEKPVLTFSDSEMTVASSVLTSVYPRSDVRKFDFVDNSFIADIGGDDDVIYTFDNASFSCPGHTVTVFTLSGAIVASAPDRVSLENLSNGIYIVNVNNKSIKICKK